MSNYETQQSLVDTLNSYGLFPPYLSSGELVRFAGADKGRGNKAGWAYVFPDGRGAVFGDFSQGLTSTWQFNIGREYTREEKREFARQQQIARELMARQKAEKHQKAKEKAIELWTQATPVTEQSQHAYLIKKKIQPHNTRLNNTVLFVPIYDANLELCSLQMIHHNGDKPFLTGGKIKGCFTVIGEQKNPTDKILICEGFATGASLHEDTGHFTVCAMTANNLEPVAITFKQFYPQAKFIICGDNDLNGVGQTAAKKAAGAIGCAWIVPEQAGMDFNDAFTMEG